jgi:hypothetical protein
MTPLSTIKFRAIFPYVSVDATNTLVATVYRRKTGTSTWSVGRRGGGSHHGGRTRDSS